MAKFRTAFHRLKDLELILSYSDSTLDADNFDKPITKVVNSETRIRIDMKSTKYYDFFVGDMSVTTKYGIMYPWQTTTSSFYIADRFHDIANRKPGYKVATRVDKDDPLETLPDHYAVIRF